MIQRIQSIYLLLVTVLMGVSLTTPMAWFTNAAGSFFKLESLGITLDGDKVYPTWGIFFVGLICAVVAFYEIFLYKNRKRQIMLSKVNVFLIVFFYITVCIYGYFAHESLILQFSKPEYGSLLPIIAFIFNILAMLKIKKDEKLVRSLDRIR